jgi:hypothetical protein
MQEPVNGGEATPSLGAAADTAVELRDSDLGHFDARQREAGGESIAARRVATMTTAIEKAQAALRAKREAGETVERLDPIERARRNPQSRALAIAAKCWDCQGAGADPGTRQRIGECSITRCPLHSVRPHQSSTEETP